MSDTDLAPGFVLDEQNGSPAYRLYTAREIAEELGVVERTVRRWIVESRLPATKERGVYRIRLEDAREVFDASRAGITVERSGLGARVEWLEAENDRLWSLLELALRNREARQ